MVERGYQAAKLDPFGGGFYELERGEKLRSIALVEAVRAAVGPDFDILIEMHGRFNPATAIEIARELEPFRPGWLEEPVPPENLRALKKVADAVHSPVATGERIHTRYEYRELFELQACDIIQMDPTHFGGLTEARKLAAWADCYYVLVAPHNVCGPVGTAAVLHLAAGMPNFKIQEHFNDFADAWVKQAVDVYPEVVDGYFSLPERPGLGVELERTSSPSTHARRRISTCTLKTGTSARHLKSRRVCRTTSTEGNWVMSVEDVYRPECGICASCAGAGTGHPPGAYTGKPKSIPRSSGAALPSGRCSGSEKWDERPGMEPALRQVVHRRQDEHLLQLPRPAPGDPRARTRPPSCGRVSPATSGRSPTRNCTGSCRASPMC